MAVLTTLLSNSKDSSNESFIFAIIGNKTLLSGTHKQFEIASGNCCPFVYNPSDAELYFFPISILLTCTVRFEINDSTNIFQLKLMIGFSL